MVLREFLSVTTVTWSTGTGWRAVLRNCMHFHTDRKGLWTYLLMH
uniref:Uncharacterized protein n=1 Tax=Anguilla anguilla TaxID=7936 RepID=A0A0E9QPH7_ANGAN